MKPIVLKPAIVLKPGRWLDWDGVIRLLKSEAKAAGGMVQWATANGVSYEYVRLVSSGKRIPGRAITKALGLEKALMWRTPARLSHPVGGSRNAG